MGEDTFFKQIAVYGGKPMSVETFDGACNYAPEVSQEYKTRMRNLLTEATRSNAESPSGTAT